MAVCGLKRDDDEPCLRTGGIVEQSMEISESRSRLGDGREFRCNSLFFDSCSPYDGKGGRKQNLRE
jgi:hypothetical protein